MIQRHTKKIVLVTTGQPSTNPRMMKEVDALLSDGYTVKVFYSYWVEWAAKMDNELLQKYPPGIFVEVSGNPTTKKNAFLRSRVFHKMARSFSKLFPFLSDYALSRTSFDLAKMAKKEKADLFIAHNLGALPAAAKAAKKISSLYAFDAEDYHRGEYKEPFGKSYSLTKKTEEKFLAGCDYITAASPLIADAYNKITPASKVQVINNVFSKKYLQKISSKQNKELSIFWFSQTIGADRGLETIIAAMNQLPQCKISLHLMGNCSSEYRESLIKLSSRSASISFLKPEHPDKIFSIAAQFDIGLAAEIPYSDNRNFCLTNKIFTYLLAGNFILASNTLAQENFMNAYKSIGALYDFNDINALSVLLEKLYYDRDFINDCRKNSLELASTKLNWEIESKTFLSIIDSTLNDRKS